MQIKSYIFYILLWAFGLYACIGIYFIWNSSYKNSQLQIFTKESLPLNDDKAMSLYNDLFLSESDLDILKVNEILNAKYKSSGTSLFEQIRRNPTQTFSDMERVLNNGNIISRTTNQSQRQNTDEVVVKPTPHN